VVEPGLIELILTILLGNRVEISSDVVLARTRVSFLLRVIRFFMRVLKIDSHQFLLGRKFEVSSAHVLLLR
jgi:hypothetical protein